MTNLPATVRPVPGLQGVYELSAPLPCLPCPFCGGTRFVVQATDRYGNSEWGEHEAWAFQIRCTSCNAEGPANKTSAESACRQWNLRTIHGLDLVQLVVQLDDRSTCPDCGRHPLLLAPRDLEFRLLGQSPFFWLCGCGAIRQAGNPKPISVTRQARPPEPGDLRRMDSPLERWETFDGVTWRETSRPYPTPPPAALETGLRITDRGLMDNVVEPHGARVPPPNYGDLDAETEAIDGDQVV